MFLRLFRLSDRLGRLFVRASVWVGDQLRISTQELNYWLRDRFKRTAPLSDPDSPAAGQIGSLSGLVVLLLVAVVALTLYATAPRTGGAVIQLLSTGGTPAPANLAQGSAAIPNEAAPPIASSDGTILFSMYEGAQEDIYALSGGESEPVRLTDSPADDRYPAWAPDGQRIAFASRRDGNWELYVLQINTGDIVRLTYDLAYEADPTWSSDGAWIAYEAYYEGNLDIYIVRADGSEAPQQLTRSPYAEYSPAWSTDPTGRQIAYVSNRDGNEDIYIISLDDPREELAVNLTATSDTDEHSPAWSPDGSLLAYESEENGVSLVNVISPPNPANIQTVGQGRQPAWSPDGKHLAFLTDRSAGSLLLTGEYGSWDASVRAFALPSLAHDPNWSDAVLPEVPRGSLAFAATAPLTPAYEERLVVEPQPGQEAPYSLVNLQTLGVIAEAPYLSDRVDGSFSALRAAVSQAAGWDFLGQLDSAMWDLGRRPEPGQAFQNWHKAGRAFDVVQNHSLGDPAQIELIPEQRGADLFWHLYVRCAIQDGSLGAPLSDYPWDFNARISGDVDAYENGGRLKTQIPSGYYVDFTEMAQLFGWEPVPADTSWRYNWAGILFWQYEKRDELDWWSAMLELYPEATLVSAFGAQAAPQTGATPRPIPIEGNGS